MRGRIKLAYGNYGMPGVPWEDAIPQIRAIGYEGIEICTWPGWPTSPERLDMQARRRLGRLLLEHGLEPIALVAQIPVHLTGPDDRLRAADSMARTYELGAAITGERSPLVSLALGGKPDDWLSARAGLASNLQALGGVAERCGSVLAVEPHVGSLVDTPERALWLMEAVGHARVRLNFDMSHFHLAGLTTRACAGALLPYTVHIHIKDGRRLDQGFEFLLPGEGDFDLVDYLRVLQEHAWSGYVTAEVSAHVRRRANYEPFAAARAAYEALRDALAHSDVKGSSQHALPG